MRDPYSSPVPDDDDARWYERAACLGMKTRLFYPEKGDGGTAWEARMTCWVCPVRQRCLDEAMLEEEGQGPAHRAGYRGGMSSHQRAVLARGQGEGSGVAERLPVQVHKDRARAIREWALGQGYRLAVTGPLPHEVVTAYTTAHPHEPDPETRTPPRGLPVIPVQRVVRRVAGPVAPPGGLSVVSPDR